MKKPVVIFIVLLSIFLPTPQVNAQQNIQFTQYIFNSLSVNPGYAGYKEEWFAQLGLRSQWTGWDGAPKTGSISIDGLLDPLDKRHGIGLQITADAVGHQSATSAYVNYALRLQLDDADTHRLALGIAGGITQYALDGTKLDPVIAGDHILPSGMMSTWNPDIRLGVYYHSQRWYAGLAVHDLFSNISNTSRIRFQENTLESLYRNVSLYFISGALFDLDRALKIRPSILIKDDLKGPTSLDLNAMFIFDTRFWIGGGYRTRTQIFRREYQSQSESRLSALNSAQGVVQFHVNPRLRIGYSYDLMINDMSSYQGGTHEVTIGLTFMSLRDRMMSRCFF